MYCLLTGGASDERALYTRVVAPSKLGEGEKRGRSSGNLETFGFEPDRYSILSGKGWSPVGTECCVGRGDAYCEAYTGSQQAA